jgi:hypothetical protein
MIAHTCTFDCTDYLIGVLNLTRQEQIVVIFVLIALLAGAGIRHFRMVSMLPAPERAVGNESSRYNNPFYESFRIQ